MVLMLGAGPLTCFLVAGTPSPLSRPERTDPHGDPLPPSALARLGTVRFRQESTVEDVAFLPDGKTLASRGSDGSIVLHDRSTGKKLRSFPGDAPSATAAVYAAAFAPDGKTLAAGVVRRRISIREVMTGTLVCQFRVADDSVRPLVFSRDGRTLAGLAEDLVQVWDVRAGKEMARIAPPPATWVQALALAPDGKTVAAAVLDNKGMASLCLWETSSGRKLSRWHAHEGGVSALAFSPDGKRLASANVGKEYVGEEAGRRQLLEALQGSGKFGGEYLGGEYRLRVWRVPTGERQLDLPGRFTFLRFSPCGKVLAAVGTGSVSLHEADTGKETRRIPTGVPGGPVGFSPDGKVLAVATAWTVHLWNVGGDQKLDPPPDGHDQVVEDVMFLPDGRTLASMSENAVYFWQAQTGRRIGRFKGLRSDLNHQALSPDGKRRAAAGWSKGTGYGIGLWDTATGKKLCELEAAPQSWPRDLVFSPDGKTLAAAVGDLLIRFWDVGTGKPTRKFAKHAAAVSIAFSPDGKTLAAAEQDLNQTRVPVVRLLDAVTGRELRKPFELPGPEPGQGDSRHCAGVGRVAFSADGKVLAAAVTTSGPSGTNHTIQVWEVQTGQGLCRIEGLPARRDDVGCRFALSPDGKSLLTPGEPALLLEVATGKLRGRLRGHSTWVKAVAFSPDGRLLATGSRDTTALVWNALNVNGEPPAAGQLSPKELEARWADLAGANAALAYRAIRALVAVPAQAVPFLRQHLRPVPTPDAKHLARLITDLDSTRFAVRERATRQLEELGVLARPALEQALAGRPSLEFRRRAEGILNKRERFILSPEELRGWRAVEALEHIGTPQARKILEELSQGTPSADVTVEATAALQRLVKRQAVRP
jgi:WD40 repeat protein